MPQQQQHREDKATTATCLKMVKFGMGATLIQFKDKYYEYGGGERVENRGLTIGGYESAWFADLVTAYLLAKTKEFFERTTRYRGIYRDDGLAIMRGHWSKSDVARWLESLQLRINQLAGSEHLKFTAVIWGGGSEDGSESEWVSVEAGEAFPYLEMELRGKEDRALDFGVYGSVLQI